jgi:hypothetical protein
LSTTENNLPDYFDKVPIFEPHVLQSILVYRRDREGNDLSSQFSKLDVSQGRPKRFRSLHNSKCKLIPLESFVKIGPSRGANGIHFVFT